MADDPAKFSHPEWAQPGWVAFNLTDENVRDLIWLYAQRIRKRSPRLSEDIHAALRASGYDPINRPHQRPG